MLVCAAHDRWVESVTVRRGRPTVVKRRCPECNHRGRKRALRIVARPPNPYED
jgi:hypothetical protein